MISYAQNLEDVRLARALPHVSGFFIDVGAADPVSHSVTKWFSTLGWHGMNVEPLPSFFNAVVNDRPTEINLNIALAETSGELEFFEIADCIGWSTLDRDNADKARAAGRPVVSHRVTIRTLADVCHEFVGNRVIDFLKVDVEGAERAVLLGADWSRWRPRVVLVEATEPGSPIPNHERWEDILIAADYRFAVFDGLNRFYVRAEDEALIPTIALAPNVFDEYVTHELIERDRRIAELEARLAAFPAKHTQRRRSSEPVTVGQCPPRSLAAR